MRQVGGAARMMFLGSGGGGERSRIGAIGFGLSAVLRNQVTLNKGVVEQRNFDDYEPTRMREMPRVEVHLVRSEDRFSGIGEPGVPPLAPAVGNAILAAQVKRLRGLPFGSLG